MRVEWRHGLSGFCYQDYVWISLEWRECYKHWIFPLFHEMMHALPMKFGLHRISGLLYRILNDFEDEFWVLLWDKIVDGNWKVREYSSAES